MKRKKETEELIYQRQLVIYENEKKASKFFKVTPQKPESPKERAAKKEREHIENLAMQMQDRNVENAIKIQDYLDKSGIKYKCDYTIGKLYVRGYFSYEVLTGIFRYNTSAKYPRRYPLDVIFTIIDNIKNGGTGGKNKQSFRTKISDEMRFFQFNDFFKTNKERYELEEDEFMISNYCLTAYLEDSGWWRVNFHYQFKEYFMNDKDLKIALEKNLPE